MRVLVAGATGVIGGNLVPLLRAAGHDVVAMSRRPAHGIVAADALDREAVRRAVRDAAPDVVVNMLTAIPAALDPRHLARDFALTNRLRTEGTRNLIEAAGGARIISQGLAYAYQPAPGLADEDQPLWTSHTPKQFVPVLAALIELERLTVAAGGLVLRFGHLYGPGTAYAPDGSFAAQVRAGKVPLVGGGHAVFSFTHTADAAGAVVAALDRGAPGRILNVVDDTPVPLHDWLPAYAQLVGGPAPKPAPAPIARLIVGGWGVAFMNRLRGADNARARKELDWTPRHPSFDASSSGRTRPVR
jgi:nucleoside-diphosphate-sugar epimerase